MPVEQAIDGFTLADLVSYNEKHNLANSNKHKSTLEDMRRRFEALSGQLEEERLSVMNK